MMKTVIWTVIVLVLWQQNDAMKVVQKMTFNGRENGREKTTSTTEAPDPRTECTRRQTRPIFNCNADYTESSEARLAYKYYSGEVDYATAMATCEADGAYVAMIKKRCDEYEIALVRKELGIAEDVDIWLGMRQTSHYTYTFHDGDTLTLNADTGNPLTTSRYHRFSSEGEADITETSMDDDHCIRQNSVDQLYSWYDKDCSDSYAFICICYDVEQ